MIAAAGTYVSGVLPLPEFVLQALNFVVSLAVITGVFAVLFKYLPDVKIEWHDVLIGAVFTAVFSDRQVSDRNVPWQSELRVDVRRGRLAGHRPGVGLLLGADLFLRSRIYAGLCSRNRVRSLQQRRRRDHAQETTQPVRSASSGRIR